MPSGSSLGIVSDSEGRHVVVWIFRCNCEALLKKPEIFDELEENVFDFISELQKPGRVGRYLPCKNGYTKYGESAELGLSCFALKIFHLFRWWDRLPTSNKDEWVSFINSYLVDSAEPGLEYFHAYLDPVLVNYLRRPSLGRSISRLRSTSIHEFLRFRYRKTEPLPYEKAIIAETKQAIATLAEIGAHRKSRFSAFPQTPEDVSDYMSKFDWALPWNAGGQTASLAVFLSVQAPKFLSPLFVGQLRDKMGQHYRNLADKDSGGYFADLKPSRSMLINGGMKVLTALDWLDEPIHFPEKLIDTVLHDPPVSEGCDLVDAIYVLFRCVGQSNHRRKEVEGYLLKCAESIRQHARDDGGFSYSRNRAQKWYYGMPISTGLREGDLHGTLLLCWALIMVAKVCFPGEHNWETIRP